MFDNSQSTLPNSICNAAADDIVPWVTVGQCGFQLPKVKFAPNQKWISPWMGPGKAHSFEALPDRKVARIGEASILRKPFKAIHLVHIGKGLGQVDHKVFNCLFYYASLDFVIDAWTHPGTVKSQARDVDLSRTFGLMCKDNQGRKIRGIGK